MNSAARYDTGTTLCHAKHKMGIMHFRHVHKRRLERIVRRVADFALGYMIQRKKVKGFVLVIVGVPIFRDELALMVEVHAQHTVGCTNIPTNDLCADEDNRLEMIT